MYFNFYASKKRSISTKYQLIYAKKHTKSSVSHNKLLLSINLTHDLPPLGQPTPPSAYIYNYISNYAYIILYIYMYVYTPIKLII